MAHILEQRRKSRKQTNRTENRNRNEFQKWIGVNYNYNNQCNNLYMGNNSAHNNDAIWDIKTPQWSTHSKLRITASHSCSLCLQWRRIDWHKALLEQQRQRDISLFVCVRWNFKNLNWIQKFFVLWGLTSYAVTNWYCLSVSTELILLLLRHQTWHMKAFTKCLQTFFSLSLSLHQFSAENMFCFWDLLSVRM